MPNKVENDIAGNHSFGLKITETLTENVFIREKSTCKGTIMGTNDPFRQSLVPANLNQMLP